MSQLDHSDFDTPRAEPSRQPPLSASADVSDRAPADSGVGTADHGERRLQGWRHRYEGSVLQELGRRLAAADFGNRIILFGAALLLSVLPMVILLSAFASTRVDDDIARHLGLNREGSQIIEGLIRPAHGIAFNLAILVSLLLSLAGTVTVASSVQPIYENVYGHPHVRSLRNLLRCLVWVVCVAGRSLPMPL